YQIIYHFLKSNKIKNNNTAKEESKILFLQIFSKYILFNLCISEASNSNFKDKLKLFILCGTLMIFV
ncbi:hypothetical protein, partial [Flavobacterium sp. YO12]|uniref:hypothetical protein n=1 Tax=Flavobacterium sp. YO12 TaxID=1920029 RepID=UPI0019D71B05